MSYQHLRPIRKRSGLRQQDIADAMGVTAGQVSKWESGKNSLPLDRPVELANAYRMDQAEVMAVIVGLPLPSTEAGTLAATKDDLEPNGKVVPMEGPSEQRMERNVPIYGTALGATTQFEGDAIEQTTLNTGDVIGYARRPVILDGRADAYGLYVAGSSMSPAHEEGDMILVETKRPARVGDDVVVYLRPENDDDDGMRARAVLVKRLVRRTASYIELQQFNPPATFRLAVQRVVRFDRVLRLADLID